MILEVLKYGHPVLRQKRARVDSLTRQLERLLSNMFETMYDAHGVGLAAPQVGHALQLTIIDVRGVMERPSTLERQGKSADVAAFMPLVLINPEIQPDGEPATGPEGCLSFPEVFADITRPESVEVTALNAKWERLHFKCGGLLARAVQHEYDHLQGILFIDRMTKEKKAELKPELDALHAQTKAALKKISQG